MSRVLAISTHRAASVALGVAAESVLSTRALHESVRAFMQHRALSYYAESLRQYFAVRVGVRGAVDVFTHLAEAVAQVAPEEIPDEDPSVAAQLFALAREVLGDRANERAIGPFDVHWYRPADDAYAARLASLRAKLSPFAAELLELRFARGLTNEDLAYVVDEDPELVSEELDRAVELARTLLGPTPPSRNGVLAGALLECFALAARDLRGTRTKRPNVLPVGTVIGDRYEVESHLGAGAFADVYRARDREVPDHVVALKLHHSVALDEDARRSALRELRLIASVFHPSVVQLKDHGWYENRLWFVMPFYRGETLATRLSRGPLTRIEARRVFQPLAHALATMHRAGVRHQDIKPENIFLARLDEEEGEDRLLPILLDLGVAAKDAEVVLAGTPQYFAPEVAARFCAMADPPPVTAKADVFSLALSLRHALDPACREEVLGGVVDEFVRHRAMTPPLLPPDGELAFLSPYFARWLGHSPDERPSAEELARELHVLTAPEERRDRRNRVLRWAVPTAVALITLFGSVTYTLQREASYQRIEAERARQQAAYQRSRAEVARERAETIRADLYAEAARRRELEQHIHALEERYQSSRLTREELAARLARAQGELGALSESHEQLSTQLREMRRAGDALARTNQSLRVELDVARAERDRERDRVSHESDLRQQLGQSQRALTEAREQLDVLAARVRVLERHVPFVPPTPYEDQAPEAVEATVVRSPLAN